MKIKTDGRWKQFKFRYEVPKRVLAREFDWLDEESGFDGFFKYQNRWYHTSMFSRASGPEFAGWDGVMGDSFFSGILLKLSNDGEEYKVGTYIA